MYCVCVCGRGRGARSIRSEFRRTADDAVRGAQATPSSLLIPVYIYMYVQLEALSSPASIYKIQAAERARRKLASRYGILPQAQKERRSMNSGICMYIQKKPAVAILAASTHDAPGNFKLRMRRRAHRHATRLFTPLYIRITCSASSRPRDATLGFPSPMRAHFFLHSEFS